MLDVNALVLDVGFDELTLPDGWQIETGSWVPTNSGLVGSIDGDSAAVIWSGMRCPAQLAVVFEAEAMPGHDNDANAFFRAAGSIYGAAPNDAWIAGTAGWYVHDNGLEQHPHGPTWRVPGLPLVPGQVVRVAAGYRRGRVFLWKDGRLLLERDDPHAGSTTVQDRIGLGTWDAAVRFLRLSVYDLDADGSARA